MIDNLSKSWYNPAMEFDKVIEHVLEEIGEDHRLSGDEIVGVINKHLRTFWDHLHIDERLELQKDFYNLLIVRAMEVERGDLVETLCEVEGPASEFIDREEAASEAARLQYPSLVTYFIQTSEVDIIDIMLESAVKAYNREIVERLLTDRERSPSEEAAKRMLKYTKRDSEKSTISYMLKKYIKK